MNVKNVRIDKNRLSRDPPRVIYSELQKIGTHHKKTINNNNFK